MQKAENPRKHSISQAAVELIISARFSATFKNHSARHVPRAVGFVKAMHAFQSFSTVPCKVQRGDMASKKPRLRSRDHQIEICPSSSPWYLLLTSSGELWNAAEPTTIAFLFSRMSPLHLTSRSSPPVGRSILLPTTAFKEVHLASGSSTQLICQPGEDRYIYLSRLLQ